MRTAPGGFIVGYTRVDIPSERLRLVTCEVLGGSDMSTGTVAYEMDGSARSLASACGAVFDVEGDGTVGLWSFEYNIAGQNVLVRYNDAQSQNNGIGANIRCDGGEVEQ